MIAANTELKQEDFQHIRSLILREAGINLSNGKLQLVQSRLLKRLRHFKMTSFREYMALLNDPTRLPEELTHLINALTTNKTDFFREPHHFDYMRETVLPRIMADVTAGRRSRRIRIWHAGCSTGQEPYSMAMTIADVLRDRGMWDVRLLASDIDTNVLETAQAGTYPAKVVEPVPVAMRERYMTRSSDGEEDAYTVGREIKSMIAFRQINLTDESWPIRPDVRFDVIMCRNVIIYFDKDVQRRLFHRFEGYLPAGGHLFIGHSESLLGINATFQSLGGTIYRKPVS
jgi:chemotaxis protein methyltransferase CheR